MEKVAAADEWGVRTPNIDVPGSWYRIAIAECSRKETRGRRLPALPRGLHRVMEDVQLCEAGKVDEDIAHLNSKPERSGVPGRLLVSTSGIRGNLVAGVNLASIDFGGRGRDFRCADKRAEVGSPGRVREERAVLYIHRAG